ncbi:chitinase, partial [Ramicandelaber brevisporus]
LAASLAPALAAGNGKIVVGYYASWVADKLTGFDFSQLTHVQLAFGIPAQDGSFAFDGDSLVPGVVSKAHAVGTKVVLSLGGWTGSYAFSPIVASAATRTTFVNNIVAYLAKYNLDGIDIDWEYPGRLGDDCNKYTASDTANYLLFLKQLRPALDAKFGAGTKLISAAVRVEPFDGADGPLADISAFVPYFDYLSIMAYDLNGSWSTTTGPNAGLNYQAGKGEPFSVAKAIATWTKAGFPAAKLVLGTPFYGHSMTATQLMTPGTTGQYSSKLATVPKGDQDDDNQWKDPCSNSPAAFSGDWAWRNLRSQGVLTAPTVAGSGWSRYWDDTTKTPWLFNNQTKVFISYDDPVSLGYKVDYAAAQGLLGVMTWALDQD